MPFKTKVVPDWKIQKEGRWGKTYPKAEYPSREKQPIALFDIKEFVNQKRESKLNNMMNSFESKNPFDAMIKNSNSINPFGNIKSSNNQFNDIKSSNPTSSKTMDFDDDSFDIDDLVKKIDAKIAELEEQEKMEAATNAKVVDIPAIKEEENKVINGVTDDQFFDDFFSDD